MMSLIDKYNQLEKENKELKKIILNMAMICETLIEKVDIVLNGNNTPEAQNYIANEIVNIQYSIKKAKEIYHG